MSENNYHFFENHIDGKNNEIYDYSPVFDSTGDFKRVSGIDVAIQSIRTLLLTPLGHYPFDPQYGSLLYEKLFEPSDDITKAEIEYEVKDRINQYEDRVKVVKVDSYYTSDRKMIVVNVHISREEVEGQVSLTFDGNNRMFGLEDDITAGLR